MSPPPLSDDESVRAGQLFLHHEQVVSRVRSRTPSADIADIHDGFVKVVMLIAKEPARFDPGRGDLVNFLVAKTESRLRDVWRSNESRRRREQEKDAMVVAERQSATRKMVDVLADMELTDMARADAARTDEERRFLDLWASGGSDHDQFVLALRAEHLGRDEQELLIKQTRDRLTLRLRRWGKRWTARGADA
jgi:hypothetical protein